MGTLRETLLELSHHFFKHKPGCRQDKTLPMIWDIHSTPKSMF